MNRHFLTGTLFGLACGAGLGLLLAPKSGKDARRWIGGRVDNTRAYVNRNKRALERSAGRWIGQGKEEVAEVISAGRRAVQNLAG